MNVAPILVGDRSVFEAPVPRILHFVWVGSDVPEEISEAWDRWVEVLPEWEAWFHTDSSGSWPLTANLTRGMELHPTALADIIRVEVVCRQGGIYLDSDTRPVEASPANLERARESAFIAVLGHPEPVSKTDTPWLGNGLFGFPPGHLYMTWLWNHLPPRLPGGMSPVASPYGMAGPLFYRQIYRKFPYLRPRVLGIEALPDVNDSKWKKDPTDLALALGVHLQAGSWYDWKDRK